ncbi:Asp-tRNA(Asn)/Glu-tRNA(Gln) amidotransferase subunit GatB [Phycisphaera mikurensis]|uniref:Aspartyl/glutamyl-tRNA(Asn/Gln) amidotransferase subunit B n=1 Tax=Phycisphaera mikurensis (strain NBRC 102666 / KCTC 22515 / FYK2301M01) TaxID=1142394 RepID=I0IHU2_PHYMF|nr:Asp-tRNA(Asn)/Glu-tRNA(Gln) amidotransferase subunit GatB [Phycisphaera mikurensis]MBB6441072.1 aspartyl-tRNA(Asn)/glutamyl-tRNA(Gln) amidotransferase subunit B [Phycisphaera mikurensis]BAM04830.1 aspartyl/glutamyl-tRNA(Asn/Gln) amidotransferase subunit B [Phycisphaera mikurensis NBRC 102666]
MPDPNPRSGASDPGEPHGLTTTLVVGMEVHVELMTRTKMWTSAPNVAHPDFFDAAPNALADPVVVALPGTLPVMNRAAVEMSVRVGLALGSEIADSANWDRKSYFYPDLPKNYQISQYDRPLCLGGSLDAGTPGAPRPIRVTRAHLEEDAGKLMHELPAAEQHLADESNEDVSFVDLNRAGTPLLEIVSEPDVKTADEAVVFCERLRELVRHLGVTAGVMQRGHVRFEPNINVVIRDADGTEFKTPIVEVKNLNSFKAVRGAIEHEHRRQVDQWVRDGKVMRPGAKATRGWDDAAMVTTVQREKEDAQDYRYFPDPDLVEVSVGEEWLAEIRASQPELPSARRSRYAELGIKQADAEVLMAEPSACAYLDAVLDAGAPDAAKAAAFLLNTAMQAANAAGTDLAGLGASAEQTAGVLKLLASDQIASSSAGDLLETLRGTDAPAESVAAEHGLLLTDNADELDAWVAAALADPAMAPAIEDVKAGKKKAIGALVGRVMKESGGKANPKKVAPALMQRLG